MVGCKLYRFYVSIIFFIGNTLQWETKPLKVHATVIDGTIEELQHLETPYVSSHTWAVWMTTCKSTERSSPTVPSSFIREIMLNCTLHSMR